MKSIKPAPKINIPVSISKAPGDFPNYSFSFILPNGAPCRSGLGYVSLLDCERAARGCIRNMKGDYSPEFRYLQGV